MATARSRTYDYGTAHGTYQSQSGNIQNFYRGEGTTKVDDLTDGFGTDNYLGIVHAKQGGGTLSGFRPPIFFGSRIWNGVPVQTNHGSGVPLEFQESEANAAVRAFNITNPGRPEILLPVFLAELRDIPKMVRQLGDTLRWINNGIKRPPTTIASGLSTAQKLAADNLAYQFGWAPLVSDLTKMADFTLGVHKRKNELSRLHRGNGLKRRITLEKREAITRKTGVQTVWSTDGSLLTYDGSLFKRVDQVHRWATLRYQPTSDSPLPSQDMQIRAMMTGLTANSLASNLWEAIPWTWFADYFSNLGDLVQRTNNSAFVRVVSCCVMSTKGYEVTIPRLEWNFNPGVVAMSSYYANFLTKSRHVGLPPFPMPEVSLPLLGGGQLSILTSMAVMRVGK